MDNCNITGGNRHNFFNQSFFDSIVLGRKEYDAGKLNCWPFCKATDVRDGIAISLGNLCKDYSFV